jgi:hypothetical protein
VAGRIEQRYRAVSAVLDGVSVSEVTLSRSSVRWRARTALAVVCRADAAGV